MTTTTEGPAEGGSPDMKFNSTFSFEEEAKEEPYVVASRLREEIDEFDRKMGVGGTKASARAPVESRHSVPARPTAKRTVDCDIKQRGFDVTMKPMSHEARQQEHSDRQDVLELDRFGGADSDSD